MMAISGKEAWEAREAIHQKAVEEGQTIYDKIALVLTDLEMPEMDGFTLTHKIKKDARFARLPTVIHSSLSGTTNEDHVKSVGVDAYVAKFNAEDLAETIRNGFKRQS